MRNNKQKSVIVIIVINKYKANKLIATGLQFEGIVKKVEKF